MEIHIKEGSPDGMHVVFETYVLSWDDLLDFIKYMADWECTQKKKMKEHREEIMGEHTYGKEEEKKL